MTTKTYNLNISLSPTTSTRSAYNADHTFDGIENFNYISTLSDGIYDNGMIIRNGKIIPALNNGNVSLADSYIKKNNKEFYSIQSSELLSNLAYIYERQDDVISIAKKLSIEIDKPSYIESELISNLNLIGVKTQLCKHSNIASYLSTITDSYANFEVADTIKLNETSIAIKTRFFPILPIMKIFGYNNLSMSYLDLSTNIISISRHTGEVEISASNIDHVKIIYFVSPVAVNKEINILEPLSGDFVGVVSNAEHLYTNVSVSGANMMLDTEERIDCEIVPKNFVDGIDASKNIIINGKISKTSPRKNKYTISPSYNLSDNLIETDINFNLPELTNNINMAILGMFNDAGNKRLSTMCVGVSSIPTAYQSILSASSSFNTIIHNTSAPLPAANNGNLSYSITHTTDNGYSIVMPAWIDESSISIQQDDGVSMTSFTNYTFIAPDIILFDKEYTDTSYTYYISAGSFVSPIISIIDSYNHKAYIASAGNIFAQYPTLESLYLLCKDNVIINYINRSSTYAKTYFKNKTTLTVDVSKKYIKTNLDKYKSLILES